MDFLDPNKVINQLNLTQEMIAADFGSGSGGWVIPLAKKLKEGKVFAIDIQQEPLSALQGKAKMDKLFNIQIIRADVEKPKNITIGDNFVDLVLMTNLLFQVENKRNVFAEAKRILKKGGMVLVVDWLSGVDMGPTSGRINKEEALTIAKEVGFTAIKELEAGYGHFGILLEKQ